MMKPNIISFESQMLLFPNRNLIFVLMPHCEGFRPCNVTRVINNEDFFPFAERYFSVVVHGSDNMEGGGQSNNGAIQLTGHSSVVSSGGPPSPQIHQTSS